MYTHCSPFISGLSQVFSRQTTSTGHRAYETGRRHHAEDDPHRAGAGTTGFPRIELEEGTHPYFADLSRTWGLLASFDGDRMISNGDITCDIVVVSHDIMGYDSGYSKNRMEFGKIFVRDLEI